MFIYRRQVHFYETDLMGIVHHANYLRFLEEARVAWGHVHGLIRFNDPQTAAHFAVLETRVRHLRPARFGDSLEIDVEVKGKGARIFFQYRVRKNNEIICVAETDHAALNANLKPVRLSQETRQTLEKSLWTETWLSNL
jgi:acyl-CoA thioester hydrolase